MLDGKDWLTIAMLVHPKHRVEVLCVCQSSSSIPNSSNNALMELDLGQGHAAIEKSLPQTLSKKLDAYRSPKCLVMLKH